MDNSKRVYRFVATINKMGKTNPIGVRFDEELLRKVKDAGIVNSPQKALNLYERSYVELIERKVEENNLPVNKERILSDRENMYVVPQKFVASQPLPISDFVPSLVSKQDAATVKLTISSVRKPETGQISNIPEVAPDSLTMEGMAIKRARIKELEYELGHLPASTILGLNKYKEVREQEITKLKRELGII